MIFAVHKKGVRLVGSDRKIDIDDAMIALARHVAWTAWEDAAKAYGSRIDDDQIERLFEIWWRRTGLKMVKPDATPTTLATSRRKSLAERVKGASNG